jgi:hypothetical protein
VVAREPLATFFADQRTLIAAMAARGAGDATPDHSGEAADDLTAAMSRIGRLAA